MSVCDLCRLSWEDAVYYTDRCVAYYSANSARRRAEPSIMLRPVPSIRSQYPHGCALCAVDPELYVAEMLPQHLARPLVSACLPLQRAHATRVRSPLSIRAVDGCRCMRSAHRAPHRAHGSAASPIRPGATSQHSPRRSAGPRASRLVARPWVLLTSRPDSRRPAISSMPDVSSCPCPPYHRCPMSHHVHARHIIVKASVSSASSIRLGGPDRGDSPANSAPASNGGSGPSSSDTRGGITTTGGRECVARW